MGVAALEIGPDSLLEENEESWLRWFPGEAVFARGRYHYVIAIGGLEGWKAAEDSFHYVEDENGQRCLLVFTALEEVGRYLSARLKYRRERLFGRRMLADFQCPALEAGHFVIVPVDYERLLAMADATSAQYLMCDPRSGLRQEIL